MSKPIDALGNRVDPEQLYVCLMDFHGDGLPDMVRRGAKFRGRNPAVHRFSGFWVLDTTPDDERPSVHFLGRR